MADILAEHASRTSSAPPPRRRTASVGPRLVRREDAGAYLTAPQLMVLFEAEGWIVPTCKKHRMVLFDLDDVDACIDRLKSGEFPGEQTSTVS